MIRAAVDLVKNNTFAKNSLVLFLGTMAVNVINYLFHLILGRMVDIKLYGEAESLISLMNIISVPAIALTLVVTKYSAGAKAENNRTGTKAIWEVMNKKVFALILPLFFIALLFTPLVKDFMKIDRSFPIVLIWIMMLFSFFVSINNGILTGWQKFGQLSALSVLSSLVKLVAAILFVRMSFGLGGILGGFLLGGIATYFGSLFAMKFLFSKNQEKEDKKKECQIDFAGMKKYVLPALIGTLTLSILGNVDMVLAKNKLDAISSGQYGALTIMSKAIFYATGAIATVLFAMSAEENHKKQKSAKSLKNSLLLTGFVSIGATVFYFLFPKFVVLVFFGEKYLAVSEYLGWFAILASLHSFANLFIQYLLSTHKTDSVWFFLIVVVLEVVAIFFWGKNIYDIVLIAAVTQLVIILSGFYFVFAKEGKGAELLKT